MRNFLHIIGSAPTSVQPPIAQRAGSADASSHLSRLTDFLVFLNAKHFRRLLAFSDIDKRCINHVLQMRRVVLFDHLD